jgi:PleD family two-component response regulator
LCSTFAKAASEVDGRPVGATVSIGLVVNGDKQFNVGDLLGQADQALYYAKERGRNRVEVATLDLVLRQRDRDVPAVEGSTAKTAA